MKHPCREHETRAQRIEATREKLRALKSKPVSAGKFDPSRCQIIDRMVEELMLVFGEIEERMDLVKHGLGCQVCLAESRRVSLAEMHLAA